MANTTNEVFKKCEKECKRYTKAFKISCFILL